MSTDPGIAESNGRPTPQPQCDGEIADSYSQLIGKDEGSVGEPPQQNVRSVDSRARGSRARPRVNAVAFYAPSGQFRNCPVMERPLRSFSPFEQVVVLLATSMEPCARAGLPCYGNRAALRFAKI